MAKSVQLHSLLAWAGALPFAASGLLIFLGIESLPVIGDLRYMIEVYGLIIATFIAGSHWGLAIGSSSPAYLLIASNLITLGLWVSFLWVTSIPLVHSLIAFFILLLAIDLILWVQKKTDTSYCLMRCAVTTVVCLSLILTRI